jgi:hypothetical protein
LISAPWIRSRTKLCEKLFAEYVPGFDALSSRYTDQVTC